MLLVQRGAVTSPREFKLGVLGAISSYTQRYKYLRMCQSEAML